MYRDPLTGPIVCAYACMAACQDLFHKLHPLSQIWHYFSCYLRKTQSTF